MSRPWYEIARQRAKERKLSYAAIGARMGVHKSTVGHWLTGHSRPGLVTVQKLAEILDTTLTDLVSEDPYFITDDLERNILDAVRELPPDYQEQALAVLKALAPTK